MGSAIFASACGRSRRPWPCPRASSARWTDRHGAGSARLCRGPCACTASRPWSWPHRSGPVVHPGKAGTRAAGTGNPGHAIRPPPSRARQSDLATASAAGDVRLRQCRPWGSQLVANYQEVATNPSRAPARTAPLTRRHYSTVSSLFPATLPNRLTVSPSR